MRNTVYLPPMRDPERETAAMVRLTDLFAAKARTFNAPDKHDLRPYRLLADARGTHRNVDMSTLDHSTIFTLAMATPEDDRARDVEAHWLQRITAMRRDYPHLVTVVYTSPDSPAALSRLRALPAFAAAVKSVDVTFVDLPAPMEVPEWTLQSDRLLKSLVTAVLFGRMAGPVVSPELVDPASIASVTLGDLTLEHGGRDTVALLDGQPLKGLPPTQLHMLHELARHGGSYMTRAGLMQALYGDAEYLPHHKILDVMITKTNKELEKHGLGPIRSLWGAGRYVRAEDFRRGSAPA